MGCLSIEADWDCEIFETSYLRILGSAPALASATNTKRDYLKNQKNTGTDEYKNRFVDDHAIENTFPWIERTMGQMLGYPQRMERVT